MTCRPLTCSYQFNTEAKDFELIGQATGDDVRPAMVAARLQGSLGIIG